MIFRPSRTGAIIKETLHDGAPTPVQAWYFNTRREAFKDPRVREAIGLCFDFEWTNKNVMYLVLQARLLLFPEHGAGGQRRAERRRN